jgi:peptide/nickel transport system substrate-binding protein
MKKMLLVLFVFCSGVANAAPFVFPKAWTVSQPAQEEIGGSLRDFITQDYQTYNPFTDVSAAGNGIGNVVNARGLFITDPITGESLPYMAESYVISSNKLNWTIKVRRDMKWSDGEPVLANDWVVSTQIHTAPNTASNQRDAFFVDGKVVTVKAIDDYTLVFSFPKIVADAVRAMSVPPAPAHIFQSVFETKGIAGLKELWSLKSDSNSIVSAGAFKLADRVPGVQIAFERNPYFGDWNVNEQGLRLPYLQRYVQKIYLSRAEAVNALLNNEIDMVNAGTGIDVNKLREAIKDGKLNAVLKTAAISQGLTMWAMFNWNRASDPFKQDLFRNVIFRQAMSHMMNRQAVVSQVFQGLAKVQYGTLNEASGDWLSPDAKQFPYDLEAAANLLAKIGFKNKNSDGYLVNRDAKIIEFDLLLSTFSATIPPTVAIVLADAQRLGIKINPKYVDNNQFARTLTATGKDRSWDAALTIGAFDVPGQYPLNTAYYSCKGRAHYYNASGECIDTLETQAMMLNERARQNPNPQERLESVRKVQEVMALLQPVIHLLGVRLSYSWLDKVQGELSSTRQNQIRMNELTWIQN